MNDFCYCMKLILYSINTLWHNFASGNKYCRYGHSQSVKTRVPKLDSLEHILYAEKSYFFNFVPNLIRYKRH